MQQRTRVSLLFLALAVSLLAGACGSDDSYSPPEECDDNPSTELPPCST
jgi:hypothetical protein